MNTQLKRIQQLTLLMLILASSIVALSLLPRVDGVMAISVLEPSSGNVGTLVSVAANVSFFTGGYDIYFDQELVANGTAVGYSVVSQFTVPPAAAGDHTVRIVDLTSGDNATRTFTVNTAYSIELPAVTKQYQESDGIPVSINITGGESNKTYVANITVQAPTNVSYVKMLDVAVSNVGTGLAIVTYPNDFSSGANTSFVGNYYIVLNSTLASKTFSVGLTNSTEYHRSQIVNIKALYEPDENVTLTIAGKGVQHSVNLTDPSGLINYNWSVPANAAIGSYSVNVASVSGLTTKTPPDTQNFTVPGFAVNITAKNLAGNPVSLVTVRAYENSTNVDTSTTDSTGLTQFKLETGNYSCVGFFKGESVAERSMYIDDTASLDLVCNLTNLRVQVVSVAGSLEIDVPEAGVFLTPDNKTYTTDINGTVVIQSLLPNTTYGLNMTRYNTSFNVTALPHLLVNDALVAWFDVKVACPVLALQVTAVKSDGQPLDNALVKVQEMLGSPRFEAYTGNAGTVAFTPPLGKYRVQVLTGDGIMLNETTLSLFQDQNITIPCDLYGLTVSVKVLDYFGQGIANVNVKVQRDGQPLMLEKTQGDGSATFTNVIGGQMEVALYLGESNQPVVAQGFSVEDSRTIQLKIDKYVVLAGMLVETSLFATAIIIVLIVVLVLIVEIYRIRKFKPAKSKNKTESPDKEP